MNATKNTRDNNFSIKSRGKSKSKYKFILLIFVILWTTFLLFIILKQQASNLEANFKNAEIRRKIINVRQEVRERNDKLHDAIDVNAITARAEDLGLTHIKENQKRLIPQVESNRLIVHREDANAVMADGEVSAVPFNRIYHNLENYFAEHRDRVIQEAENSRLNNGNTSRNNESDSKLTEIQNKSSDSGD